MRSSQSFGTETPWSRATLDRSFRIRSAIITFSARSFSSASSAAASAASASGVAPRPRVPLIGSASATPSSTRKNSSGEADSTSHPSPAIRAAKGASVPDINLANSASPEASLGRDALSRRDRLA